MTSKLTREQLHERARENVKALKMASRQTAFGSIRDELLADLQLAEYALAALDSEPVELPLDYLQGHKDGLEWAAQLAKANHPETGDWLYDDPIELAKAISKGPDMPPSQPALDSEPVAYMYDGEDGREYNGHNEFSGGGKGIPLYRHAQQSVVPENRVTAEHRRVIEMLLNVCGAAFELADDSCQQDIDGEECHVVPDDAFQKLSDALDEIENTLQTEDIDRPDVFLAWSAMPRAALKSLLQAGNSPAIPDGFVMVPKEPTQVFARALCRHARSRPVGGER